MTRSYFYYEVGMKTPTLEFRKEGFAPHTEDIGEAVKFFNNTYKGEREAILLDALKTSCHILLAVHEGEKIAKTAKDLVIISKYLYNDKNWRAYSREKNTLFYLKRVQPYDGLELQELFKKFGKDVYKYIDPVDIFKNPKDDLKPEKSENEIIDTTSSDDLSEEQAIAILRYLFCIKEIGNLERRLVKNNAISKIKAILNQFA